RPTSTLLPYTTLFRSRSRVARGGDGAGALGAAIGPRPGGAGADACSLRGSGGRPVRGSPARALALDRDRAALRGGDRGGTRDHGDRKSTRLNSSHVSI